MALPEQAVRATRGLLAALDPSGAGMVVARDLRDIYLGLGKDVEIADIGEAVRRLTPGHKRYVDMEGYAGIIGPALGAYAVGGLEAMHTMFRLADNDEDSIIEMDQFRFLLDTLLSEEDEEQKKIILKRVVKEDPNHVTFDTFVNVLTSPTLH